MASHWLCVQYQQKEQEQWVALGLTPTFLATLRRTHNPSQLHAVRASLANQGSRLSVSYPSPLCLPLPTSLCRSLSPLPHPSPSPSPSPFFSLSHLLTNPCTPPSPGFTLVQGPPGTGKTATILGILNAFHIREYNRYYQRAGASEPSPP